MVWMLAVLLVVLIGLGIAAQIALNRAEPVLRARVLDTLATRYDSRIELDRFHVSVIRGFEAEGDGLRLYPNRFATDQPFIAITKFTFRVSWLSLIKTPMHVGEVDVEGMTINIPPKDERGQATPAASSARGSHASSRGSAGTDSPCTCAAGGCSDNRRDVRSEVRSSAGNQNVRGRSGDPESSPAGRHE